VDWRLTSPRWCIVSWNPACRRSTVSWSRLVLPLSSPHCWPMTCKMLSDLYDLQRCMVSVVRCRVVPLQGADIEAKDVAGATPNQMARERGITLTPVQDAWSLRVPDSPYFLWVLCVHVERLTITHAGQGSLHPARVSERRRRRVRWGRRRTAWCLLQACHQLSPSHRRRRPQVRFLLCPCVYRH
jgi:hypothetical protein